VRSRRPPLVHARRSPEDLRRRLPAAVRRDWDDLATATRSQPPFDPATVAALPGPARRWLLHAIAPGTPLRRSVELRQHGRIRLCTWRRFRAAEIISPLEGYIWAATTTMFGIPIHGYDRLTRGSGEMVHRAFGRLPIVEQDGPDLTRSAAGRLVSEMVWAPAVAVGPEVRWKPVDEHSALALLPYGGDTLEVRITTADSGALQRVDIDRWARLGRGTYRLHPFTAEIHREATFGGYTVPSQLTAGYPSHTEPWPGSAFIRTTIDEATFR
jgi:hypothetical protein